MMRIYPSYKIRLLILTLFIHNCCVAHIEEYWQQEVNYNIDVTLIDSSHKLSANISIEYKNNSPDKLDKIYIHLWPNAFSTKNTAFAKQHLQLGKTDFYYANKEALGYINKLDFRVDGFVVQWKLDSLNPDIAIIELNEPLFPGKKIEIFTPFNVKLPNSFSRLGHVGESYQITQWYPKPAVYDKDGWHPMPYLDMGEFYSEYGSFDVKITLPKNYIVGATGYLQNPEEIKWLDEKAKATNNLLEFEWDGSFPTSSDTLKTLHYKIDNVHDFAWFADKRFHVLKNVFNLPSGREVTAWAMFTNFQANKWKKSIEYIRDGVLHYSKYVGEYPYNVVTAVEGALSAGGGMEYPTITIIGRAGSDISLETVIVHEVGHNWFYGQLGFNERDYPWMDEGINSFYVQLYFEEKYPGITMIPNARGLSNFFDLNYPKRYTYELLFLIMAKQNKDQAIGLKSVEYKDINYAAMVYAKTSIAMYYLRSYLGEEKYDKTMRAFYKEWEFKHPDPDDMQQFFENYTGINLDWFFDDLINTADDLDYKITKVKKPKKTGGDFEVSIKNTGELITPITVSGVRNDTVITTQWMEGFDGDTTITVKQNDYHYFRIDNKMVTTQINRANDTYRLRGLIHKTERFRMQLIGSVENPYKTQLYFTPTIAWNNYDKTLIGLALYNHTLPFKKFQFELLPFYATATNTFTGMGKIGYNWLPKKGVVQRVELNTYGKRFSYELFTKSGKPLAYNKFSPEMVFHFKPNDIRKNKTSKLSVRTVSIWQEFNEYNSEIEAYKKQVANYTIFTSDYKYKNNRTINPFELTGVLQHGKAFSKLSFEGIFNINISKRSKGLNIRLFAGSFLWNTQESGTIPDTRFRVNYGTGRSQFQKDYMFDELYFGRNDDVGIFSQQVFINDGGFRGKTSFYGQTNKWLTSVNIKWTILNKLPLKPYIGFGLFGVDDGKINYAFEAGISIVIMDDVFEIHLPLATIIKATTNTKKWYPGANKKLENIEQLHVDTKYWSLITFTLNLKRVNPFTMMDELSFY